VMRIKILRIILRKRGVWDNLSAVLEIK